MYLMVMRLGKDEAYYGWLAVNYLVILQGIGYGQEGCIDGHGKRIKRTVGALDWGGESLEIAFEEELIHTKSFSEIGANGILTLLLHHLLQSSSNHTYVFNPCFPLDYKEERDGVSYVGTGNVYSLSNSDFQLSQCESIVSALCQCNERESDICHLQELPLAYTSHSFFGMSLLFYVADFLSFVENRVTGNGNSSAEYQRYDELSISNRLQLLQTLSWKQDWIIEFILVT